MLSLFLVDRDAEEELGAPGLRDNPGTAAKTRMSETTSSSGPSPLPDFAKGKLATGFKFKVFVYEEDLPRDLYGALRRDARCSNEYSGLEALLPSMIKGLDVYTPYGENADYYVVPVMTECFLKRKLMMGKDFNWAVKDLNSLFEQTLARSSRLTRTGPGRRAATTSSCSRRRGGHLCSTKQTCSA